MTEEQLECSAGAWAHGHRPAALSCGVFKLPARPQRPLGISYFLPPSSRQSLLGSQQTCPWSAEKLAGS